MKVFVCFFLLVVSASVGTSAFAKDLRCNATQWPFARVQSRRDLFQQFRNVDRKALTEYYFYELIRPSQPSLAEPLSTYLRQTELNEDMRTFYDLLNEGAGIRDRRSVPKALKLHEICDVYRKVLSAASR